MIDAHLHLWDKQHGMVDGLPVYDLGGGRSQFGSVVRQMTPAYINDGVNSVERLLANMDFAQVAGAVVTQEYIDGNQDAYLRQVRQAHPLRLRVSALYEEKSLGDISWADGWWTGSLNPCWPVRCRPGYGRCSAQARARAPRRFSWYCSGLAWPPAWLFVRTVPYGGWISDGMQPGAA